MRAGGVTVFERVLPRGGRAWRLVRDAAQPKVPKHLSGRFRTPDSAGMADLHRVLTESYFGQMPEGYLQTHLGRDDLHDHLSGRLDAARKSIVPWLDDARRLDGATILEIGCGTGSSTLALAEQGAAVTGVDIDEGSLAAATERCRCYGVDAEFLAANGRDVEGILQGQHFDLIVFYASLEHMTVSERLAALRGAWERLQPGDCLVVADTPNRLWPADDHSSQLPFFNWLPDELALQFAQASPRELFRHTLETAKPHDAIALARFGRGVSYHEFEIALGSLEQLGFVSSASTWRREHSLAWRVAWRATHAARIESVLRSAGPSRIPIGFYQSSLELVFRKPATPASAARQSSEGRD
jgi:ubiquinone/menaquinone biosynthesis C-methylase UbiE